MEHIVQESAENSGSIENISFCYDLPLSVNQKERKSFTKQSSTVHYVRKHLVSQSVSDNFALHMSFFLAHHALIYLFYQFLYLFPYFLYILLVNILIGY